MSGRHGQRPPAAKGKLREPATPVSHDKETPKFCLHHVQQGFDVHALGAEGQGAFAKTLQKLAAMNWTELITSGRQRGQSDRRPARRGRGASKTSDHALPASGPAHAAFCELMARSRTWPSRIA
jgi:hypothetical protein